MCEFISIVRKGDKVYFLTTKLIESKKGKELLKDSQEDIAGHGAIRLFFGLEQDEGTNEEYTDFSSPDNFPSTIVTAIKKGEMAGLGMSEQLLTKPAQAEYDKIIQSAQAEYEKIKQSAWAEYEKIIQSAWAEYDKIIQSALAEYEKIGQSAFWGLFAIIENRNPKWR